MIFIYGLKIVIYKVIFNKKEPIINNGYKI